MQEKWMQKAAAAAALCVGVGVVGVGEAEWRLEQVSFNRLLHYSSRCFASGFMLVGVQFSAIFPNLQSEPQGVFVGSGDGGAIIPIRFTDKQYYFPNFLFFISCVVIICPCGVCAFSCACVLRMEID